MLMVLVLHCFFFSYCLLSCSLWFSYLQKHLDQQANQFMLTSRGLPPQSKQPYPFCSFPGILLIREVGNRYLFSCLRVLPCWQNDLQLHVNYFLIQFVLNWLPVPSIQPSAFPQETWMIQLKFLVLHQSLLFVNF